MTPAGCKPTHQATAPLLIAGGGIAGLALALARARLGAASVVLEARAEPSESGAGIQIGPNGTRLLGWLGVADRLAPLAARPEAIAVRSAGREAPIATLPLGKWIEQRHGAPYWVAHRQDLHRALLDAAETSALIETSFGFKVAVVEERADGVSVASSDGRRASGRLLAGADGLWSTVRGVVEPHGRLRFTGRVASRTVVPAGHLPPGLDTNEVALWLSPAAHVVHYPVRAGAEHAIVVIRAGREAAEGWDAAQSSEPVIATLGEAAPVLAGPLAGAQWRSWSLQEPAGLARWATHRMVLLGDAAHPVLPFLAQGAVLAIEDAVTLALLTADREADPAAAFARYCAMRRPRAEAVASAARRNGAIYHLRGAGAFVRDRALAALRGATVMRGYDWLYGARVEGLDSHAAPSIAGSGMDR